MKSKQIKELKNRPPEELAKMIKESNEKLRVLRFDLSAGKVKNVSGLRELKKTVARMKTFIREAKP